MRNVTRAAGAMPRREMHMRVRDARVSVLYILAHTVYNFKYLKSGIEQEANNIDQKTKRRVHQVNYTFRHV
jgi:hypothetical protein